ncbi:hypothetical protein [Ramlibacter sp.]|uniref:hypothetical protein n=1 Tax=Ramlibacter sp. TaxID=1917967 RepID=UPI002FC7E388
MTAEGNELAQLTAAIFHAIGRNLMVLQEMESMLRSMVIPSELSGPASQLAALQKKRAKRLKNAGLGSLAGHFADKILTKPAIKDKDEIPEVREPHFSFSFSFDREPADAAARKKRLSITVKRRNKLVHGIHDVWSRDSIESSRSLLQRLEDEHQESLGELQLLRVESEAFQKIRMEVAALIRGADFKRALSEALRTDDGSESGPP